MENKQNPEVQEEPKDIKPEQQKEVFDITKVLEEVQSDEKIEIDVKKHENDEDMKKIRKKYKKLLKDVNTLYTGKLEVKDKILSIFDKFQKIAKETKGLNEKYITNKASIKSITVEKERASEDHKKLLNVNGALENFCKDLQKQNQELVELHKRLQNDEKEIRTKLAEEFQQKINDISNNLEKQVLENLQKSKENEILKEKLKEVQEKYDSREAFFSEEMKNRDKQISDHNEKIVEKFKEIENEALNIETYKEKLEAIKEEEGGWNNVVQMYLDKAMEFQNTMVKANDFFTKIKKEMEKMSNKIANLDNNNMELQRKCEKTDVAIIEMIEENVRLQKELTKEKGQTEGLESLYKKLQEDLAEKVKKIEELKKST